MPPAHLTALFERLWKRSGGCSFLKALKILDFSISWPCIYVQLFHQAISYFLLLWWACYSDIGHQTLNIKTPRSLNYPYHQEQSKPSPTNERRASINVKRSPTSGFLKLNWVSSTLKLRNTSYFSPKEDCISKLPMPNQLVTLIS